MSLVRLFYWTKLEEQVLRSSLLPAFTHAWDPNSQALLHDSGSLARLSSASLFRWRSISTIPTLQTSYHFRCFRIKGCLSSGIAFQASCQQQGSAKKTNNGQFVLCWRFQSTSPQRNSIRRANLYPICISLSLAFTCIYQCALKSS